MKKQKWKEWNALVQLVLNHNNVITNNVITKCNDKNQNAIIRSQKMHHKNAIIGIKSCQIKMEKNGML